MTAQKDHVTKTKDGMSLGQRTPDCAVLHAGGRTAPSFRAIDQLIARSAPSKQPRTGKRVK